MFWHLPVEGSQLSDVQGLLSLQLFTSALQLPLTHWPLLWHKPPPAAQAMPSGAAFIAQTLEILLQYGWPQGLGGPHSLSLTHCATGTSLPTKLSPPSASGLEPSGLPIRSATWPSLLFTVSLLPLPTAMSSLPQPLTAAAKNAKTTPDLKENPDEFNTQASTKRSGNQVARNASVALSVGCDKSILLALSGEFHYLSCMTSVGQNLTWQIRRAQLTDLVHWVVYKRIVVTETPYLLQTSDDGAGDWAYEKVDFTQTLEARSAHLLLAVRQDHVILGHCHLNRGNLTATSHVATLALAVVGAYWRRGIGGQLLQHAIDWALLAPHLHKISLQVHATNTAAQALYTRQGFCFEGRLLREARRMTNDGDVWDDLLPMGLWLDNVAIGKDEESAR